MLQWYGCFFAWTAYDDSGEAANDRPPLCHDLQGNSLFAMIIASAVRVLVACDLFFSRAVLSITITAIAIAINHSDWRSVRLGRRVNATASKASHEQCRRDKGLIPTHIWIGWLLTFSTPTPPLASLPA